MWRRTYMFDDSSIKLSVIVPVYNSKNYLSKCINSIIEQDYRNIEIILVDDGSTDGSSELCDLYERSDQRIRVIHQENSGCIRSRICGLENSKGQYVGFVDSDDWIDMDMYKTLMLVAEKYNCDIVSMGYTTIDQVEKKKEDDATLFGLFEKEKNMDKLLSNMMYDAQNNRRGIHPSLCTKVIKKSLLQNVCSEIDETISLGEDAALFYPCCLKAKRIFVLKEYKYYYRIRENSMCRKFNINTVFNIYSFYLYMKKILLKDKNQYDLLKQLKMYTWSFLEQSIDQLFNIRVGGAFIFPYEIIEKNSDIVLYGAGIVGNSYFRQIKNNNYCNIIAWIDKNKSNGQDIMLPNQICNFNYSKIIIAIMDSRIADQIMNELIMLGVEKEKILWKKPQEISTSIL